MRSLVHHIIDILVYIILYVQPFNISYTYIYVQASINVSDSGVRSAPLDNQKTPGINLKVPRSLCISAINVAVLEIEVCGYSEFIFAMNFIPPG